MTDQVLIERIGTQVDRRKFLGKMAAITAAGTMWLMRIDSASAGSCPGFPYGGCCLCGAPSSCSGCDCTWCWTKCVEGTTWGCCECWTPAGACNGTHCTSVICSWAFTLGSC